MISKDLETLWFGKKASSVGVPAVEIPLAQKEIDSAARKHGLDVRHGYRETVVEAWAEESLKKIGQNQLHFIFEKGLHYVYAFQGENDLKGYQMGLEGIPMVIANFAKQGSITIPRSTLSKTIIGQK